MQIIPLNAVPSQTVTVQLGSQNCRLNLYQKSTGLYGDVYVGSALIIAGVICRNNNLIVRDAYLGFIGDLAFIDSQGSSDPDYTGLGARFNLAYFTPADLAGA